MVSERAPFIVYMFQCYICFWNMVNLAQNVIIFFLRVFMDRRSTLMLVKQCSGDCSPRMIALYSCLTSSSWVFDWMVSSGWLVSNGSMMSHSFFVTSCKRYIQPSLVWRFSTRLVKIFTKASWKLSLTPDSFLGFLFLWLNFPFFYRRWLAFYLLDACLCFKGFQTS